MRATTLCIDGRSFGACKPPAPASGSGVHLNQIEIKLSKREVLLSGECNSTQIFDLPESLSVHVIPSGEVRIVPE